MSILQEQQIDDVQDVRYADFAGAKIGYVQDVRYVSFAGAKNWRRSYRGKSAFLEVPLTKKAKRKDIEP